MKSYKNCGGSVLEDDGAALEDKPRRLWQKKENP